MLCSKPCQVIVSCSKPTLPLCIFYLIQVLETSLIQIQLVWLTICHVLFSVKDGLCPRASPYGPCVTTCGADEDCDGSKKCCSNGCGSWCLEPSKNIVIVGVVFLNGSQFVVIQTSLKSSMICYVYGHCYERRRHLFHGNAY